MNNESPFEQTPEQRSIIGKLIRFCVTNKLVVGLFVLAVIATGIVVAPFDWKIDLPLIGEVTRYPVPVDAIPDIGENQQIVFTQWMGRSPQDMEDQISYPLTVSLLGVPGIKTIRSYSFFGFSTIYIIFKDDVEFYWSRTRVLEKLNSLPAGTLPPGVQPVLGPDATALGQIYWYTLEGRDPDGNPAGGWDLDELRTIQDWNVRYRLLSAEGVAEVASIGGYVQEYQVDVDPDAMRAYGVTLADVFKAVKASNIDVGAKIIELNRTEYFVRGVGFIKNVSDIENSVVKVRQNVPILVKQVANVTLGPAMRRGALDKGGAQAVGGVVVARYGDNPLRVIKNVKEKIAETAEALPSKVLIDFSKVSKAQAGSFAKSHGFKAFKGAEGAEINKEAWLGYLRSIPPDQWPQWVTISKVTIVPFYDRTGLIYETLGTLNDAISMEILITMIVIIVMVIHLRSSLIISGMLPLAVLLCFIGMKLFGVDANIVALSGIVIAIGTIVDVGIVVCENTLRHLDQASPDEPKLAVVHRAASEVGGAVLTAVLTTVVSFLPVFTMIGAEGKLFKPLAYTKTFALLGSIIIALTVIPPVAYMLFCGKVSGRKLRYGLFGLVGIGGLVLGVYGLWQLSFLITACGVAVLLFAAHSLVKDRIPQRFERFGPWVANTIIVLLVGVLLTKYWEPLGPQRGLPRNLIFVGVLIGGLLGFFHAFRYVYAPVLRWCLRHKLLFLSVPVLVIALGILAWLGPDSIFGRIPAEYASQSLSQDQLSKLSRLDRFKYELARLQSKKWVDKTKPPSKWISNQPLPQKIKWTIAKSWDGFGKEFMPPLDEGSYLFMPTTMVHASIGEALDILAKQDMAFMSIPEIDSAVGKLGRADTPLDPAPVSMIETVINYKPQY
ncbi:MAG TPA: efflux RND transporter permease subunit, partial [Phycisphaerae bacterium]|nr:efflux RND transporter permease subunit [Phycisphaerae bacterium]